MKKNNERITLSDKAYFKYYNYSSFVTLFFSSLIQSKFSIMIEIIISLGFMSVGSIIIDISIVDKPREFISVVCTGLTTYSITTIGFLLISFTMLMILNNHKLVFKYFSLEDTKYKKPLISILLGVFIIPIGVFILLLLFSMITRFLIPVFGVNFFSLEDKKIIFKLFIGISFFLFVFSILEFLSFFHNIYKFIIVSSYDMSIEYEQKIIKSTILPQMSLNEDKDIEKIKENIINVQEKLNRGNSEIKNGEYS